MSLAVIILLILLGLILLVVEIFFLPGTTVAGVIAVGIIFTGIFLAYTHYGTAVGTAVMAGSVIAAGLLLYFSFRSGTWKKLQVHASIDSKANEPEIEVKEGDTGVTISRINPMGKALINNRVVEVQSLDGLIDHNTEVVVFKAASNKIIVRQKT